MAASIFISYRRQDAIKDARAVFERLRADFGAEQVFIDLEGLGAGEDFVESLERQLAHCRVMLVLMGPQWLDAKDGRGQRRIDNGSDFVRLELHTALGRPGVKVVPLLIDGTEMPAEEDLPADLHPLLRRQAMSLRFVNFDADMRNLAVQLTRVLATPDAPVAIASLPPAAELAPPQPAPVTPTNESRPIWANAAGRDEYGRWAEFTVRGVVQRLRWIEPGEFLMGSSPTEADRSDDEGPQHRVRLTRGYWLADTACTQALWLAVVEYMHPQPTSNMFSGLGRLMHAVFVGPYPVNSSGDPLIPVVQVSHEDAEGFVAALRDKLGGAAPALPTEAEWEYACRAGTGTAYSWGNQPDDARANFGDKLGKTTPVKRYPPNAWGLYDMHGNVWEWCADDWGTYADTPGGQAVVDPVGPQQPGPDSHRALRGGSWYVNARYARSACRVRRLRGYRSDYLGLRLALRS